MNKEKIIEIYEKLKADCAKRDKQMAQLDVWYNQKVLGLVGVKVRKRVVEEKLVWMTKEEAKKYYEKQKKKVQSCTKKKV